MDVDDHTPETASGKVAAELAAARRRLLRGCLAFAALAVWIAYMLKTGNPHPRMLAGIVCGAYTLVAFFALRKHDLVFFPLSALLTGLSFWQEDGPGVVLGIAGALMGLGGMSEGIFYFVVWTLGSFGSC